jgi:hypothetical protein
VTLKYLSFCEARSVLFLALSKLYPAHSRAKSCLLKRALYNTLTGLDLMTNQRGSDSTSVHWNESQYANQITETMLSTQTGFEITAPTVASSPLFTSRYYLLFLKGKLLWKLTRQSALALPLLFEADMALTKVINGGEKVDKRLKAVVVCEVQKIRFYSAMRALWFLHTDRAATTSPTDPSLVSSSQSGGTYFQRLLKLLNFNCNRDTDEDFSSSPIEAMGPSEAVSATERVDEADGRVHTEEVSRSIRLCPSCGNPKDLSSQSDQLELIFALLMDGNPRHSVFSTDTASSVDSVPDTLINGFRNVVRDSLKEIAACRTWDPYDFQSIYLLSRILQGMALSRSFPELAWVTSHELPLHPSVLLPSAHQHLETALLEIYKLFERKKVQIVLMWSHESSAHRLHQVRALLFLANP